MTLIFGDDKVGDKDERFDPIEADARTFASRSAGSKEIQRRAPLPPAISTPAETARLIYCLNLLTPALS
jgi:hypothetical protein